MQVMWIGQNFLSWPYKYTLKMHFSASSQWSKICFVYQAIIFNGKNSHIFPFIFFGSVPNYNLWAYVIGFLSKTTFGAIGIWTPCWLPLPFLCVCLPGNAWFNANAEHQWCHPGCQQLEYCWQMNFSFILNIQLDKHHHKSRHHICQNVYISRLCTYHILPEST